MMRILFSILVVVILWSESSLAFEFPAQARVFAGVTGVDPVNLNQELAAQGLQEFSAVSKLGVEITYPLARYLDVGINYTKRYLAKDEADSNPATPYQALINQDSVMLVARVPFLKTDVVRLDVFGGVGGSNTTLSLKTATQDGELTRRESNDWFASPYAAYGASVAVGYKKFYFVLEGGMELNKVDSFKRTGTVNDNIQTIDLSGSYVSVGLLINGISATAK